MKKEWFMKKDERHAAFQPEGYEFKFHKYAFDPKKEQGLDIPAGTPMHQTTVYHGGKFAGSVNGTVEGTHLHIADAGLWDEHHGKGVGKAMYEHLYRNAAQHGIKTIGSSGASEEATRVHDSISRRHGLEFKAGAYGQHYKNPFAKAMAKSMPLGIDLRKAAPLLQLPAPQGEELVHYSPKAGLKQLDPHHMGTSGVAGLQYKRGMPEHRSTFFYVKGSEPEREVTQGAQSKYVVKLQPHQKVYDFSTDADQAHKHVRDNNGGAFNEDMLHAHLKSKGYHGVKWKMRDGTGVVQMYHPTDVHSEHPVNESSKLTASEQGASKQVGSALRKNTLSKLPAVPSEVMDNQDMDLADALTKGFIRDALVYSTLAAGMATPSMTAPAGDHSAPRKPAALVHELHDDFQDKMLRTIKEVETTGGKNLDHKTVETGLNAGSAAYGKYGLMPITIKETAKLDKEIAKRHPKLANMPDAEVAGYMKGHAELGREIAASHLKRLRSHFGDDPAKLGYAWLQGTTGAKKALAANKNIQDHWHVKKIMTAWNDPILHGEPATQKPPSTNLAVNGTD